MTQQLRRFYELNGQLLTLTLPLPLTPSPTPTLTPSLNPNPKPQPLPLAGQLAPRRVFFYRDGIGVSQFPIIKQREVRYLLSPPGHP